MSLAGTSYFPYLEKNILLLEDVDEKTYHIERLLTQLEQQSDSENISAVILGSFNNCPLNHPQDKDTESSIDEFAARHKKIPMIKHFPFEHTKARICLPIGQKMHLSTTNTIQLRTID